MTDVYERPPITGSTRVAAATTTITVDTQNVVGSIDRRILGANNVWPLGYAGSFDLNTLIVDPTFDVAFREAGLTTLRYPAGTAANLFRWRRAIGPQNQRLGQTNQTSTTSAPFDSVFGLDEYGKVLDTYGLAGNIVVNFATGSAEEAAAWVEYMTAGIGSDPHGLASLRTENGHSEPYAIQYWEVGSEISVTASQQYWLAGTPTDSDIARGCTTAACRYTFGGYGHFINQSVGTYDDFTAPQTVSAGLPGQVFYVQYPPVVPETAHVSVNGEVWRQVTSLSGQGKAYTLDKVEGKIQFGDGANGQIPSAGAPITITYDSGPHDGFVAFYDAMKAVNPNIKVCVGFGSNSPDISAAARDQFVIQNAPAYDCIVSHPYVPGPSSSLSLVDYHPSLMLAANASRDRVISLRAQVVSYQPKAEVILTEYGQLGASGPADFPDHFHLTLSQGLFTANALLRWAELGVPYAQRHRLVDWVFTPRPRGAAEAGAADNSMIAGPAPFIAEPQAKVMGLFSRTMGTRRLASKIENNPADTGSWGALPNLEVLATKWDDGTVGIIVINQSGVSALTSTVSLQGMVHGRAVNVLTVMGPSLTSYNTWDRPNTVNLVQKTIDAPNPAFEYTFPAHSVTGFRFISANVQ